MRFRFPSLASLVAAFIASLTFCGHAAAAEDDAASAKLGTKIANVSLTEVGGKTMALHDIKDKKAVVIVFLNFECPNSNSYAPILAELAKTYGEKGVAFVGVCACEEAPAALAKQAAEFKLGFPICRDEKYTAVESAQGPGDPRGVCSRPQFRPAVSRPYRRRLCRPPQEKRRSLHP